MPAGHDVFWVYSPTPSTAALKGTTTRINLEVEMAQRRQIRTVALLLATIAGASLVVAATPAYAVDGVVGKVIAKTGLNVRPDFRRS